jgi:hypothetical protein
MDRGSSRAERIEEPVEAQDSPAAGSASASPLDERVKEVFPYRFWNRSTRPPLSTSFWRPVKKGWHSLHSSTCISGLPLVERVVKVFPQEQITLVSV